MGLKKKKLKIKLFTVHCTTQCLNYSIILDIKQNMRTHLYR